MYNGSGSDLPFTLGYLHSATYLIKMKKQCWLLINCLFQKWLFGSNNVSAFEVGTATQRESWFGITFKSTKSGLILPNS